MRLVLASASPQRRDILAALGVELEVRPAGVGEVEAGEPAAVARANAVAKLRAVARPGDEGVLAVDTVVALDGELWGKPVDAAAAAATLQRLSDRTHDVVSGFAFAAGGDVHVGEAVTRVTFRALDTATVAWYVASGEWEGRAGGYAIQGRGGALVRRIDGDYLNVVGLPLAALLAAGLPLAFA